MISFWAVFNKDFSAYFKTYTAYVLAAVYLILSMVTTFYFGGYFQLNNAALASFFGFQPEILALLVPALTMRAWAEERKTGAIEFLLTQPVNYSVIALAKFAAAWVFVLLMLLITFPLWLSTAWLTAADSLNILSAYAGCLLAGGVFCALGCMVSAFNSNPVITYIVSVFVCWGFTNINLDFLLTRFSALSDEILVKSLRGLNFAKHFQDFMYGQPGLDNLIYFCGIIVLAFWLNIAAIDYKKG